MLKQKPYIYIFCHVILLTGLLGSYKSASKKLDNLWRSNLIKARQQGCKKSKGSQKWKGGQFFKTFGVEEVPLEDSMW